MDVLICGAVFVVVVLIVQGAYLLLKAKLNPEVKRIQKELRTLSGDNRQEPIDIVRKRLLSHIPWLNEMLLRLRFPIVDRANRLLRQADTKRSLGVFILLTLLLGLGGFLMALKIVGSFPLAFPAGLLTGMIPPFYLVRRRRLRMQKFERQLPDALDLIARALKAGHSLTSGIQMVSQEFDDPLGSEFGYTLDEVNFGVGYKEALGSLCERISVPDLKFFAVSVIIQRQSGGNLAEILDNISRLIRERFKLRRRIHALAGESKLSATILVILPFFFAVTLLIINPAYIKTLVVDPMGRMMVGVAMIMMAVGVMVMRKMTVIKT